MATIKFKEMSQYKIEKTPVPTEDYGYNKYVEHIGMQMKSHNGVIGVALFGVGRAGVIHLTSLLKNPRVRILYIVEEDKSKWDALKNYWSLNDIKFLQSIDANHVYNDKNVRAVVVTSPTYTHETIVQNALEHDKAVFCEKPIAEDMEKSRRCFEKAKKVGQPLLAAFNRRFDAAYSSVRERVRNGEVGHVNTIKVCSRDSPLPSTEYLKISGGIFHDCAVHDIDMIVWILGEYPIRVAVAASANIPEIAELNDFDTVAIVLTFASGTVGMIDLCRYSNYGYDQRLEVFGFKGMVKVENQQPIQGIETTYGLERKTCPMYYSFATRYQNAYVNEMEHFLDVVEGKEKIKVEPLDTLAVSKIASACEEAARTGKNVEIKWDPEELPKFNH
ncbi:hypothetical protein ILUMI_09203 [Ignelater luminosus]|uniref:Inositol 2-dehydrogenase n=1 Tax=Ignelater luminosus TaxID=2038154 RepID=A0A8K0D4P9_IGNLU|nr:hypothetical protein ILUMI_09203 [Ignelater luminosus]